MKLQALTYRFSPKYTSGEDADVIEMGAYGANYNVAAKGDIYTAAVSYHLPIASQLLQGITFYNDYGFYHKAVSGFENSHMDVLGAMFTAGPMYIYTDAALGYNHPWLGPEWENAFGAGTPGDTRWHMRFNINLGYYF